MPFCLFAGPRAIGATEKYGAAVITHAYGEIPSPSLAVLIGFVVVAAFAVPPARGQAREVSGTVVDANTHKPLPGVNVVVKGTTRGTATDTEGHYQLSVPGAQDTLVFSFVGYQAQEVAIDGRATIDVSLAPTVIQREELVVTGYQVQRRAELTGAVSKVDVEEIQDAPVSNPVKSLQGRVPGLFVYANGAPGSGATVRIRGVNTLGNNDPLYIVDGIPTKSGVAQSLAPGSIASIQVLKDAASASIYGSRASNGVIVITTKAADNQEDRIHYSFDLTTSYYATKLDPLNTIERGRVLWQAAINDGSDPGLLPIYDYKWERRKDGTAVLHKVIVPEYVGDPSLGIKSANTRWFDKIARPGMMQNHTLSVSTGGDNGGVFLSLQYHRNQGIVRETDFRRLSARINSDYELFDGRLRIGENMLLHRSRQTPLPVGQGGSALWLALIAQPILPIHTEDEGWAGPTGAGFDDRASPVRVLVQNRWDQNQTVRAFGNVFAELQLTSDLLWKTRLGVDYERDRGRNIQLTYRAGFLHRDVNSLSYNFVRDLNWTLSSTLNYDLLVQNHHADILLGVEAVRNRWIQHYLGIENFAIEELDYFIENAGAGVQTVGGDKSGASLLSYFGKVNYSYLDKYLASFTMRVDGSSRFGSEKRFGVFPAFSLGWRLSEEPVVENNLGFLSNAKLRLSWGITGNQEIDNEARFDLWVSNYLEGARAFSPSNGTAYDLYGADSGTLPSGLYKSQSGNRNLKWEETAEVNVGVDFGFFDQTLTGSFDYFTRTTSDILIQPAYIAVVGDGGARWLNGATVETSGFEVQLGYQDQALNGDLRFGLTGNVGAYQDKITELPPSVVDSYPGNGEKTILGRSMNALFGYVADGIFETQEEVEAHAEQPGKGIGRLRFKDLNGDGGITPLDQKYLGVTTPDFSFGFGANIGYKNIELFCFFQGVYGPEVYNPRKIYTDFTSMWNGANYGSRTLNAWTPENRDSTIPALTLTDNNDENRMSTYFVEDGSYLKLREVQIRYTFPQAVTQFLRMKRFAIYVRGANLLTMKDNSGKDAFTSPDPENPGMLYPRPRMFTFGVDLTF